MGPYLQYCFPRIWAAQDHPRAVFQLGTTVIPHSILISRTTSSRFLEVGGLAVCYGMVNGIPSLYSLDARCALSV